MDSTLVAEESISIVRRRIICVKRKARGSDQQQANHLTVEEITVDFDETSPMYTTEEVGLSTPTPHHDRNGLKLLGDWSTRGSLELEASCKEA